MQLAKTLALVVLLTSPIYSATVASTARPVSQTVAVKTSLSTGGDAGTDRAMRSFAFACGLLAFALAAQQAFFPRRPRIDRTKPAAD